MSATAEILLAFSVDVEEEGLFSGRYAAKAEGVSNVAALTRLEFLTREFGIPLTLLCTWPVLSDPGCAAQLRRWQDELGAELGVHLHPWNTPPLEHADCTAWTASERIAPALLDAKLGSLVHACREVSGRAPLSFRMGRFDFGPAVQGLLPGYGLRIDASIVPLAWSAAQPESFLASADPFPLLMDRGGRTLLLEAPLTMAPLFAGLRSGVWRLAHGLGPGVGTWLLRNFQRIAAAGPQPVWYPPVSMRLGTRLHLSRGGRVIHMFLHSSELMPGATAHLADEAAVGRLLARIRNFLLWLRCRTRLRGVTLGGLLPGCTPEGAREAGP